MKCVSKLSIEEMLGFYALGMVIMILLGDGTEKYNELVTSLDRFEFRSKKKG